MKLQLKFMLVISLVLIGFMAAAGWSLYRYEQAQFMHAVTSDMTKAQSFLEATRAYVKEVLRPTIGSVTDRFIPEAQSSTLVAKGVFERYTKQQPEYRFKEVADNPLNMNNMADEFERGILRRLRQDRSLKQFTTFLADDRGGEWYLAAKPIVVEKGCLQCHGSPESAPVEVVERYGREHGYGWRAGDVAGALTVRVPTSHLRAAQASTKRKLAGWCAGATAAMLLMVGLCAQYFVGRPVQRMSDRMRRIAESQSYHEELPGGSGKDELSASARAFNEVLKVVRKNIAALHDANSNLERRVLDRTDEIARRKAQIEAIQDAAMDCIISMDSAGHVTEFNPAAQATFGYSREQVVGQPLAELIIPPALRDQHSQALARYLKTGEGRVIGKRIEITAVRADGSEFPAELALTLAKLDGPPSFTAYLRDITERKRSEEEREQLHRRLLDSSRQAGMAEVATGVLHNVGNVLNSVNVSATLAADRLRNSKIINLSRVTEMVQEHAGDLCLFLTVDERGKQLPAYLVKLAEHLGREQADVLQELSSLERNIEHIKQIVSMQQSYARIAGVIESVAPADLVEDALRLNLAALDRHQIHVLREYAPLPTIQADKHKALQILINLISNAKYAMEATEPPARQLTLRTRLIEEVPQRVQIQVIDNGIGISAENLTKIFSHGFTTRKEGHGFGLHSAALAAREIGGSLVAHSDGPGTGATFTLELPLSLAEVNS